MGEHNYASLPDLISAAYWHFADWHGGQWSSGYKALSSLGQVFSPGPCCNGPELETAEEDAYRALHKLAAHSNR